MTQRETVTFDFDLRLKLTSFYIITETDKSNTTAGWKCSGPILSRGAFILFCEYTRVNADA
jgi:hypothetical protein